MPKFDKTIKKNDWGKFTILALIIISGRFKNKKYMGIIKYIFWAFFYPLVNQWFIRDEPDKSVGNQAVDLKDKTLSLKLRICGYAFKYCNYVVSVGLIHTQTKLQIV